MTAIATLKALGHKKICVVDVSQRNLDIATELGASDVVQPGDKAAKQIMEACGGPVEAIIDFVNNDATARASFDALRKGGKLVQVGLFGGEFVVPTALMALKMLTITGSFVGTLDELKAVADLAKQGALPAIPIIEVPLDAASINTALDKLVQGGVPGRIVLQGPPSAA